MNQQPESRRERAGRNKRGTLPSPRRTPIAIPNQIAQMPVLMTGFATLVPHTVLDAIAMTSSLIVVQCVEPLEMFTGIETANRYVIHDMFLRPLLYCNENSGFLARQCFGNGRGFVMEIRDVYGAPLMNVQRDNTCCSCSDSVVARFNGHQIGMIQKECCDGTFKLYAAGCPQPLLISSPLCCEMQCGGTQIFPVMAQNGAKVGEIVRLFPGFLQEFLTDADTFLVHFPINMPPILKLVLISAVFLIDFTYFETDD
ncbi:unnamed protein product [Caenorhabditis sp. 36 PRJEB53466]|nr:unnamed protein product [Caenorhabditis sp. 36 PRJEB53466]